MLLLIQPIHIHPHIPAIVRLVIGLLVIRFMLQDQRKPVPHCHI